MACKAMVIRTTQMLSILSTNRYCEAQRYLVILQRNIRTLFSMNPCLKQRRLLLGPRSTIEEHAQPPTSLQKFPLQQLHYLLPQWSVNPCLKMLQGEASYNSNLRTLMDIEGLQATDEHLLILELWRKKARTTHGRPVDLEKMFLKIRNIILRRRRQCPGRNRRHFHLYPLQLLLNRLLHRQGASPCQSLPHLPGWPALSHPGREGHRR